LAGTDATADRSLSTARHRGGRSNRRRARRTGRSRFPIAPVGWRFAAALITWIGLAGLSGLSAAAEPPDSDDGQEAQSTIQSTGHANPVGNPIRASGHLVHRWQIDGAQASLLVGDCVLIRDRQEIRAEKILMVSDGPQGRVRNRIVIEGRRLPDGTSESTPRSVVWVTQKDPIVQAPRYRRRPDQRPFLMEYLPADSIRAIAPVAATEAADDAEPSVRQAKLTGPPGSTSPSGSTGSTNRLPEQIPAGPPQETPTDRLPPPAELTLPDGSPIEGAFMPPESGLPLATDPPPPTVTDDGATTGGMQFFVGGGSKSFEVVARGSSMPPTVNIMNRPETGESILVARGGVTIRVRDVAARLSYGQLMNLGTITLSADRVVGWIPMLSGVIAGSTDISSSDGELYLEGDIVFRQGDRVIYADRMYYNVAQETGMVLDAEAITSVPEYQGIVRLKADMSSEAVSEFQLPPHFTNIQHALQLARQFLAAQDTPNRQIVLITDGLPTAHFEGSELNLMYPPHPLTEAATMREGALCQREGITINMFLVPSWSQSEEDIRFAYRLAESTKGRVFFTAGRDLDRFVVWDYISRKREILA